MDKTLRSYSPLPDSTQAMGVCGVGAQIANVTGTNRGRLYAMLLDLLKPEESPLTQMNTFQQQVWRSKLGLG
jgi:hypothetical protein